MPIPRQGRLFSTLPTGGPAGVLQAAYAAGLRIPDDLSVCGYDNVLSRSLSPAIDSVGLSLEGMGGKVMDLLEERRENPNAPSRHLEIHTDYVSRGTVTAPKAFIQRPGE